MSIEFKKQIWPTYAPFSPEQFEHIFALFQDVKLRWDEGNSQQNRRSTFLLRWELVIYIPQVQVRQASSVFIIIIPRETRSRLACSRGTRICAGAFTNSCFCSAAQLSGERGAREHQRKRLRRRWMCTFLSLEGTQEESTECRSWRCYDLISRLMARIAPRTLAKACAEFYGVFIAFDSIL